MLDQLLYGVDGHIRVLASTPGLLGQGHPAANLVNEACSGEIPPKDYDSDRNQAAFGWYTLGDLRVVYLRAFEREEGSRRYASVHVLVGPARDLPVAELVVRYCSTGWWRGGSFDHLSAHDAQYDALGPALLRPASLDDLPCRPQLQVSSDDRFAIARAALTSLTGTKSTVDKEPAAIAGLLAELARDAPALLELMDVSTCDPAPVDPREPRRRPHLAGLGTPRPTGSIAPAISRPNIDRIAGLIASDEPNERRLIADASRLALRHPPESSETDTPTRTTEPAARTSPGPSTQAPSTTVMVEHFIALVCLTEDLWRTSQVTAKAVVAFFHDGHIASEILKMTDGPGARIVSQQIAAALLACDDQVSTAVCTVSRALDPQVAMLLGRDLGGHALDSAAPGRLADAFARTRTMPTVRHGVLLAALAAPERAWAHLDLLDGAVRAECCRISLTELGENDGLTDLVHRLLIVTRDNRYLAGRTELPPRWRARTLAEMVRIADATDVAWVAGQLETDRSLIDPLAQLIAAKPDSILELLRNMPPRAAMQLASSLLQHCNSSDRSRVLCESCDLVPPESLRAFVVANADSTLFEGWRKEVGSLIEQLAKKAARRIAAGAVWRPTGEDVELVRKLDGLAARLWRPIVDHYAGIERVDLLGDSISQSVRADALFYSDDAKPALWTLALAGIVLSRSDWNDRLETVMDLVGIEPPALSKVMMKAALRTNRVSKGIPATADPVRFALAVVAQYVAAGSLRLTGPGRLADPELHGLAKSLRAESCKDQHKHDWLGQEVLDCGDLALRWWQDLNPEALHKRAITKARKLIHRKNLTDTSSSGDKNSQPPFR